MPRDGSGRAHNEVEGSEIVHGAGDKDSGAASGVDKSSKAVPPPEFEKGDSIEGMNASGGGDKTEGSGKGPIESTVDKEAKKQ